VTKIISYLFGLDSFQMHTIVHSIYVILVVWWLWTKLPSYLPIIKFNVSSSPKEEPLVTKIISYLFGLDSFQMHTIVHSIYVILIVWWLWTQLTSYLPIIKFNLCSFPKEEPLVTKILSYLFGLDSFQMHTIGHSIYVILIVWWLWT
jgi:hypothetical protein